MVLDAGRSATYQARRGEERQAEAASASTGRNQNFQL
jgi:hypothetical protein